MPAIRRQPSQQLMDKLRKIPIPQGTPKPKEPLWKGPEQDGITFSLLSRFLVCRERFRLLVVEGLKGEEGWDHKLGYGNMWHVCEEALSAHKPWPKALLAHARTEALNYPSPKDRQQIDKWYNVCLVQFPVYVDYWAKHPDRTRRIPILQEEPFAIPYHLPSGRYVKLRGKWDAIDVLGVGKDQGIYLQENKTKGDVYEPKLRRQLTFDLQTMIYLVAATQDTGIESLESWKTKLGCGALPYEKSRTAVRGVLYNVVRRPLSGGKGSIVQHKPTKKNPQGESKADYYRRLGGIIRDNPAENFMRWKVTVLPAEVDQFRRECLDPILEQLCEWWSWVKGNPNPFAYMDDPSDRPGMQGIHWRHPYGVWNPLDQGSVTDVDDYLATKSELGLQRITNLFPELTSTV